MNSDNLVDEIEEVSDVNFIVALFVILFEDLLVVNVNYTILHIQLFVVHLILLADFRKRVLKDEEELFAVQIFFVCLVVVAPDHRIDLVELLLGQTYSYEVLLSDDGSRIADLVLHNRFIKHFGFLFWHIIRYLGF